MICKTTPLLTILEHHPNIQLQSLRIHLRNL
jgi:hypothetical protein